MGRFIVYLLVTIILFITGFYLFAPDAYGRTDAGPPAKAQTSQIEKISDRVCKKVVEYTDCKDITVFVGDYGTDWAAYAHPSTNTVWYNTHWNYSREQIENLAAHEIGGHIDTWNEIVEKVGVNQAWTDYYDIDYYAQIYLSDHGYTVSDVIAKEIWLDCAGPVQHGYTGYYLMSYGVVPAVCEDYQSVLDAALDNGPMLY